MNRIILVALLCVAILLPGTVLAKTAPKKAEPAQKALQTGINADPYFDFLEAQSDKLVSLSKLASGYLNQGDTADGLFIIILTKTIQGHMASVNHFLDLALMKKKIQDPSLDKHLKGNTAQIIALFDQDAHQLEGIVAKLDDPALIQLRTEYQKYLETIRSLSQLMKKDAKSAGLS